MRKTNKVLLSLIALLGLVQVTWFASLIYPIPYVSKYGRAYLKLEWGQYIALGLAAITALTCLVLLLIAIFRRQTTSQLTFKTKKGELNIDQNAVANTVKQKVMTEYPIQDMNVDLSLLKHKKAATVHINAATRELENLVQHSQAIKNAVQEQVEKSLGIPVKKININLQKATTDKRAARVI